MDPTAEDIARHGMTTSLAGIFAWAGVVGNLAAAVTAKFGLAADLATVHPRVLAVVATEMVQAEIANLEVSGQPATLVQKGAVLLAHRAASVALSGGAGAPPPAAAASLGALDTAAPRKIKASSVLDPTDESEIKALNADEVAAFYRNYEEVKGGEPMEEAEPTPEQISAMNARVVGLGLEPYGDFSVLTPYGRRMQKVLRHWSWLPNADRSDRAVEVPGPDSYMIWEACWRVYATIMLMLRWPVPAGSPAGTKSELVSTPAALEVYFEAFKQLCYDNPECWHLCCKAEDRCRAEHFPRLKRQLMKTNPATTWSDVFIAAARDDGYWDREVRRPALAFVARGSRGSPPEARKDDDLTGLKAKVTSTPAPAAEGASPSKRKRQRQKEELNELRAKAAKNDASGGSSKSPRGGASARKDNKGRFVTTKDGLAVCFKFNSDTGCPDPCPNGRSHSCQTCLGEHSSAQCPKQNRH